MNSRVILIFLISAAFQLSAQTPAQPPPGAPAGRGGRGPGGGGGGGFAAAYPQRPPADPAVVERGKAIYGVNCAFCHGSDARGGEGGPNLIRSDLVLNDKDGELIAPIVQGARTDRGMPRIDLNARQISDVAAFIHSFRVGGYDASRNLPPSILVGDAKAGEAYFAAKCASCHSVTGDLKGFGAKFEDPKMLQQTWLSPGGSGRGFGPQAPVTNVPPTTVTVTPKGGQKVEGRLGRIDDFIVTLTEVDGTARTFRRDGDVPKVEVHDPLEPHRLLLATYTDRDIHNLTAYLVTVK